MLGQLTDQGKVQLLVGIRTIEENLEGGNLVFMSLDELLEGFDKLA
jgi:hypothetical protein